MKSGLDIVFDVLIRFLAAEFFSEEILDLYLGTHIAGEAHPLEKVSGICRKTIDEEWVCEVEPASLRSRSDQDLRREESAFLGQSRGCWARGVIGAKLSIDLESRGRILCCFQAVEADPSF